MDAPLAPEIAKLRELLEKATPLIDVQEARANAPCSEWGKRVIGFKIDIAKWQDRVGKNEPCLSYPLEAVSALADITRALPSLLAALEAQAAREAEETGWLIEHEDEPKWLTLDPAEAGFDGSWTKDSLEALRFCRRQDAESYVTFHFGGEGPIRITEHKWSGK